MTDLNERVRQQKAEQLKVGVPAIEARDEAPYQRLDVIDEAIEAVPVTSSTKAAAMFMMGITRGWS